MKFPERKGRLAEQQLSRVGIGYFASNKSHPSPGFIYRGIGLSNELRKLGYSVIEVYPSATKVILFGDKAPPKRVALSFLKENLPPLIPGLMQSATTLDLGACHALLNAYTAVLHLRGETLSIGDAYEGLIIVPRDGESPILTAR
jgi:predicted nuclease with RNAse H fold